jgi:phosphoadenosine phosphosulfate reductase
MQDFFNRHEKVALMFSGGKDSIVCLDLIKDYWDKTLVVWVNTGANFPEIVEYMDQVRSTVPHFLEIKTNQPEVIRQKGYPVDVLPINFTDLGQAVTSPKSIKLRSYFDCCAENFWLPCDSKMRELGITGIIRGQRLDESHKAPVKSGEVLAGIEYFFPIEDWTNEKVFAHLQLKNGIIDERLQISHSSLDCWNCTAYLNDSKDRMVYIKNKHPEKFKQIVQLVKEVDQAVKDEMQGLSKILEL